MSEKMRMDYGGQEISEDIEYYGIKDIERILHIGKTKAYMLLDSDGFPCMRLGGKKLIMKSEFEKWAMKYAYRKFDY